ncbi:TonB-dependent receptor [Caulobacter sp. KR2-114]|uniref:TonB-dependent receptor n=1 Tax=Caulobacter sp. KR2-114 TaxID=3400912 RepID=UPI003C0C1524
MPSPARFLRRRNLVSALALLAALDVAAAPRAAHAAQAAADAAATDSSGGGMLSEVVITAERRTSTALATPIDISAVTGQDLANAGVKDFHDLTRVVPGLVYNSVGIRDGGATNSFILHGLNLDSVSGNGGDTPLSTQPAVSVYVDETPTFVNLHLADVQRVEVLRGPQATLYGDASIAGTVRVLFNRPDLTKTAANVSADVGYTNNATGPNYSVDAMFNQPLGEHVGFRLATGYTFENGFINAPYLYKLDANGAPILANPADPVHSLPVATSKKDVDDADLWYVRPMLLVDAGKLNVLFTYQHQHEYSQGPDQDSYPGGPTPSAFSTTGDPNASPGFQNNGFDNAFPTTFKKYETGDFILQPMHRDVDLGSMEASYDLGFATLTSVTSGYRERSDGVDDSSGFYQKSLGFFYQGFPRLLLESDRVYKDAAITEEVRLVSKTDGPLTYSVGAFYMDQNNHLVQQDIMRGFKAYEDALGEPNTGTDLGYVYDRKIHFQDIAAFGELTYHVTPALQVTGGVRVFRQTLDITAINELPICGSFCSTDQINPLGLAEGSETEVTKKALWKFNASYKFGGGFLAYFTFSQGERRGGANGVPTMGPFAESPAFEFFQPDTVNNYEVGLKGRIGGRFEFSSAAYWVEWNNPQVNVSTPNGAFPAVVNGQGARSRGIDLEGRFQATPELIISGTYGYTNAELTAPITVAGAVYGTKGAALPGTPHHTLSVGADYHHPITDDLKLLLHGDVSYRSSMSTSLTPSMNVNLSGFAILNAQVGVEKGPYRVSLYLNNITNERGVLSAQNPLRYDVRALNERLSRPFTVGLRVNYAFH